MSVQVLGYEPKGLPSLELGVAAELTGAWTVTAPADPDAGGELLAATFGLHVYGPHFLQARPVWLLNVLYPSTYMELLLVGAHEQYAAAKLHGSSGSARQQPH